MTKHYCDRCTKESTTSLKILYTDFSNYNPLANASAAIVLGDFCEECLSKIITFIKTKE